MTADLLMRSRMKFLGETATRIINEVKASIAWCMM